jgi:phosphoglycolate phosphatase-like HAD superfamily hydrolase
MRGLIFDLDGTLVDTVYAHVFAWQRALIEAALPIDAWRIHRRIGMSGGLFARAVARELGRPLTGEEVEAIQARHGELFRELLPERRPLPGAVELLADLRAAGLRHGIATSGRRPEIDLSLEALGIPPDTVVVERGNVQRAKPEPDLFLAVTRRAPSVPDGLRFGRRRPGSASHHARLDRRTSHLHETTTIRAFDRRVRSGVPEGSAATRPR